MDALPKSPRALLSAEGPFARLLGGFDARIQQQDMASAIDAALSVGNSLLCEAGTGTGKTLAYLVPALNQGHKTIISTATKTLQDQLFFRDIPLATEALESVAEVALLKGRANYLCLHRLAMQEGARDLFGHQQREVAKINQWATKTQSGDVTSFADVTDGSSIWPKVTSTVENCLGQKCDHFEDCFVMRARRQAVNADIVVVNHHLLFADMALKDEGFGELLPTAEAIVLDEAHQIPDIAANFFGDSVSSYQLKDFARDALLAQGTEAGDDQQLRAALECIDVVSDDLHAAFAAFTRSGEWQDIANDKEIQRAFSEIVNITAMVDQQLEEASVRGPMLDNCFARIQRMRQKMSLFDRDASVAELEPAESNIDWVRWWETSKRGFVFHATPVSVAPQFSSMLKRYPASWIFTSATLSVAGKFDYFQHQLGLSHVDAQSWPSPFDYEKCGLMYLPDIRREPRDAEYVGEVIDSVIPLIEAAKGRVFILFTSYRALTAAAEMLRTRIDFPLLVQGEASRGLLIDEFVRLGNAVLLGTGTFWQGVDVRGSALSVVVIDKLPFAPPNEPLTKARIRRIEAAGGNGFVDFQIPEAVITLKQGTGRLIRDTHDRGVLVLCDPRLRSKGYGRTFLSALPPMRKTSELKEVVAFLETL
ncbi:MAG: ATP-dependent DNA helicase [Gammaproteobacteria bacterium]